MARRRHMSPEQLDLLRDWRPSKPVVAFEPASVRGASIAVTISKAISQSLKSHGRPREEVAQAMGQYLDEEVSTHMLNSYASEAKDQHIISVVRFLALIHVTRDRRLLELLAEQFGWAVIEERRLPAIELAEITERKAELERDAEALRRQLRKTGGLR